MKKELGQGQKLCIFKQFQLQVCSGSQRWQETGGLAAYCLKIGSVGVLLDHYLSPCSFRVAKKLSVFT
jgi:hypothetical protein